MDYKKHLIESALRMHDSGLTLGTWGNVSVRDPETGYIYLTPSAMPYDTIKPEDIVVMDEDLNTIEGFRKPTIEYTMHVGIMKARKDVNAILHTHPMESQVFAILRKDIPVINDEGAQLIGGTVHCAEYALPGSPELAENVIKALGDGMAALVASHGAVCVGADMDQAFMVSTVLEIEAELYRKALPIGEPHVYDEETTRANNEYVKYHYGQGK